MIISRKTIDEVYDLPIATVIGKYTELKQNGANLKGNCPFHDEKTPSFIVSPAKGIYKCFGCGEGGNNAVTFVMKKEGLQWLDAIKQLAQQHNVIIEYDDTEAAQKMQAHIERAHRFCDVNAWVAGLYHENLKLAPAGALRCNEEIANRFNLGYADKSFDFLLNHARTKGIAVDTLGELDLIRKNKNMYDTFRERIVFPIYNEKNMIVGFSGRTTSASSETAKYLNTGETPVFKKGDELFGIHLAKTHIRKIGYAYLVEGNWDVVSAHARGLENTIAPCGTALTENQLKLLKKYTEHLVFIYDADVAGRKALLKNTKLAVEQGFNVEAIMLDEGEDPDTYFRTDKNFVEPIKNKSHVV